MSGCTIRALLDSGSETSLISSNAASKCGLQLTPFSGKVSGIGGSTSSSISAMTTAFVKLLDGRTLPITFRVLDQVTANLPSKDLPYERWPHIFLHKLADPLFHKSSPVDAIFGADIFSHILLNHKIDSVRGSPTLLSTRLGWVAIGSFSYGVKRTVHFQRSAYDDQPKVRYINRYSNSPTTAQRPTEHSELRTCLPSPTITLESVPVEDDWEEDKLGVWKIAESERKVVFGNVANGRTIARTNTESLNTTSSTFSATELIPLNRNQIWNKYFEQRVLENQPKFFHAPSVMSVSGASGSFNLTPSLITLPSSTKSNSLPPACQALAVQIDRTAQVLDQQLSRMFELESVQECSPMTPEELKAEEIFARQSYQLPNGRFCVPILLKRPVTELGDSRRIALRRLFQLESRFKKNQDLYHQYSEFMLEYLTLGHMSPVSPPTCGQKVYYLPHHAVFRQDNPTSKIRVVFNGSQRTTTGYSLNDILHTGPKLLPNILEIVTRFRQHLYVFTGDIKQMFRNINIVPHERDLLRILWRSDPNLPIQDYCLNTVTYGTTSAPYLANKVIQSLAKIGRETHPLASEILANRTYVDDCHGGGRTIEEALKARKDIVSLLSSGGFELRKWAANHPDILSQLPREHLLPAHSSVEFSTEEEKSLKILGLLWNPSADNFHYVSSPVPDIRTKRDLASQIGRIFDPLGWLMPVAVQARSIQRSVCLAKYDWDENLSFDLQAQWKVFASDFNNLPKITIPRLMSFSEDRDWLVGFADASERAYAAVVYHVNCSSSPPTVRLVLARARMAPIKQESLPRLELLAAELLSKMFSKVSPLFPHVSIDQQIAFSDSTIALSWITANPAPLWKVFVGNRVAKILDNLPADRWFHVRSSENPADLASRGALPSQIAQSSLWWTGPSWLSSPQIEWPCKKVSADLNDPLVDAERRAKCPLLCATVAQIDDFQLEQKFSNWSNLRRVVAWSLRFAYNCTHPSEKHSGALEAGELQNAEDCLIRRTQQHFLKDQLKDVQSHKPKDRLTKTLGLFIDPKGILRVGGRLSNADLPFQAQHPALLPKDSHLTKIIIASAHEQLLHVGPRTTLAWLRQKYW
ncbi:unnamed protein product, partial [Nesidiocoris tenuis]